MIHLKWHNSETIKHVTCKHTKAEKYIVDNKLTEDKVYEVKNETDEFYFIVDNSGRVGGYYKDYFMDAQ